jgi:membrane glycosyltransferase
MFFWWLTPVIFGLLLAAPIVRYSSSITLGKLAKKIGVFMTPTEINEVSVLRDLQTLLQNAEEIQPGSAPTPNLPSESWKDMPIQSFTDWPSSHSVPQIKHHANS